MVQKALRSGATPLASERTPPLPKIGPWQSELEEILAMIGIHEVHLERIQIDRNDI